MPAKSAQRGCPRFVPGTGIGDVIRMFALEGDLQRLRAVDSTGAVIACEGHYAEARIEYSKVDQGADDGFLV